MFLSSSIDVSCLLSTDLDDVNDNVTPISENLNDDRLKNDEEHTYSFIEPNYVQLLPDSV